MSAEVFRHPADAYEEALPRESHSGSSAPPQPDIAVPLFENEVHGADFIAGGQLGQDLAAKVAQEATETEQEEGKDAIAPVAPTPSTEYNSPVEQ